MFRIKNWDSFQSYKDRNPPWIRFHKKLLDNFQFQRMSAEARALLPMLWLMASEDYDPVSGMLRIGYGEIAFRLRQDEKIVKSAIDEILRAGFIERVDDENLPLFNEKTDSYINVTKELRNRHPESESESEIDKIPLTPLPRPKQKKEKDSDLLNKSFDKKDFKKEPYEIRDYLSPEGIAAAREVAPKWDIHALAEKFNEWIKEEPKNPEKAFVSWCKNFTKGKPP